jgi:hypothetical protein
MNNSEQGHPPTGLGVDPALRLDPGDLVMYAASEWTVHVVDEFGYAILRKHDDVEATGTTLKVDRYSVPPFKKAADR